MRTVPLAPLLKFATFAVVVALATTVLGLTIAGAQGGARTGYSATFTDASGLLPGDDVRIAGVVVGSVDAVAIVDRRLAKVDFSVDAGQPLPASATAAILYKNLIGQRFLSLGQGAGPTGAVLKAGDTIPVAHTRAPLNLTTLFNGFQPLFAALDPEQVNSLSMEIVQVLQGEGGTVEALLASTSSLTSAIADRDQVIGQVDRQPRRGAADDQRPRRRAVGRCHIAAAARVRARRGPAADRPGALLDRRPDPGDGGLPRRRPARPARRHRGARRPASQLDAGGPTIEKFLQTAPGQAEHHRPRRELRQLVPVLPLRRRAARSASGASSRPPTSRCSARTRRAADRTRRAPAARARRSCRASRPCRRTCRCVGPLSGGR